jgi:hypothetical protein
MNSQVLYLIIIFIIIIILFLIMQTNLKKNIERYGVYCGSYNLNQDMSKSYSKCIKDANCTWITSSVKNNTGARPGWCTTNPNNDGSDLSNMIKEEVEGSLHYSTPIKCGIYNFCVNVKNNKDVTFNKAYCYGSSSGCLFDTNDCTSNSDCLKYDTNTSPQYTDGGDYSSTGCSSYSSSNPNDVWQCDACGCPPSN